MTSLRTLTIAMTDAEASNLAQAHYPLSELLSRSDAFKVVEGVTDLQSLKEFLHYGVGAVHEVGDRYLDAFVLREVLREKDEYAEIMYDDEQVQFVVVSTIESTAADL